MNLETLTVTLNADASQYNAALDSATAKTKTFSDRTAGSLKKALKEMFAVGSQKIVGPDAAVASLKAQEKIFTRIHGLIRRQQDDFRRQYQSTQSAMSLLSKKQASVLDKDLQATVRKLESNARLLEKAHRILTETQRKVDASRPNLPARTRTIIADVEKSAQVFRVPKGGSPFAPGRRPGTFAPYPDPARVRLTAAGRPEIIIPDVSPGKTPFGKVVVPVVPPGALIRPVAGRAIVGPQYGDVSADKFYFKPGETYGMKPAGYVTPREKQILTGLLEGPGIAARTAAVLRNPFFTNAGPRIPFAGNLPPLPLQARVPTAMRPEDILLEGNRGPLPKYPYAMRVSHDLDGIQAKPVYPYAQRAPFVGPPVPTAFERRFGTSFSAAKENALGFLDFAGRAGLGFAGRANRGIGRFLDGTMSRAGGFFSGFAQGYRGVRGTGGGGGGSADVGFGTYGVPAGGSGRVKFGTARFPKDAVQFPILEYPREKIRLKPPTRSAIKKMFADINWPILTIPGDKVKIGDVPAAGIKVKGKVKVQGQVEVDPKDVKVKGGKGKGGGANAAAPMLPFGVDQAVGNWAAKKGLFGLLGAGAAVGTGAYLGNPFGSNALRRWVNAKVSDWVSGATTTGGRIGRGAAVGGLFGLSTAAALANPLALLGGVGAGVIGQRGVGKTLGEVTGGARKLAGKGWEFLGTTKRAATTVGGGMIGALSGIASGTNPVYSAMIGASGPMGAFLTTAQAASSIIDRLGRNVVQLGADYQDAAVAFEVFAGSHDKGIALLDKVQQFAVASPFKQDELTQAARTLAGYGVSMDNLLPTLRDLGEVTAGLGGGTEKLQRLALAYGQVVAAGRFMATERRQFTEAGVGVEDFAKSMGVTTTQFVHLMEEGRVSSADMVKAFADMASAGGRFGGMMERLSENVHGRWNALVETLQIAGQRVGLAFFQGFRLEDLLKDLQQFTAGAMSSVSSLVPFFERLRFIFDTLVVGARELGRSMLQWLDQALGRMGVMVPQWGDFKESVIQTVQVLVDMFQSLVNGINAVVNKIGSVILGPLGNVLISMGGGVKGHPYKNADGSDKGLFGRWQADMGAGLGIWGDHIMQNWFGFDVATKNTAKQGMVGLGSFMVEMANKLQGSGPVFSEDDKRDAKDRIRNGVNLSEARAFGRAMTTTSQQALLGGNPVMSVLGWAMGRTGLDKQVFGGANSFFSGIGATTRKLTHNPLDEKFGEDLRKGIAEGKTPYQEFLADIQKVDNALGLRGGMGNGALGGGMIPGLLATINQEQAGVARFDAFQKLRNAVNKGEGQQKLPEALVKGSAEERAELSKLQNESLTVEQEILQTLRDAEAQEKAQSEYQKKVVEVLEEIKKKGGIQVRGMK